MATTIDALGLAEDFEKVGFSRDQALGMARAIRDHYHAILITKADLRALELRLEARFAQLEAGIGQKLATTGLIRWFTGIMIAQGAAIVALIKLLP
jgi:hypothetical protein